MPFRRLRKIRPSELTNDEHTTSASPSQYANTRGSKLMITMPREGQHDAEVRRQRIVSPRNQTDMSVENGTPIWLATATVAASSAR